jgi:carbon storage regulator
MLVLSRKKREQIVIGDKITITIVEIKGNRVRIGIDAPDDVMILRFELWVEVIPDDPEPGPIFRR